MKTHDAANAAHASRPPPFFAAQAQREPAFFSPSPFPIAAHLIDAAEKRDAQTFEAEIAGQVAEPELSREEPVLQAKMSMGAPGDSFEREADAMADRVVQRKFAGATMAAEAPAVQAKCAACHEEEDKLRRQAGEDEAGPELQAKADGSMDVPGGVQKTLEGGTGGGAPMHAPLREEMESAFDTDFSGVRIHTSPTAENLNDDLNAHAFTYGQDVYFNSGEYRPDTPQGQHLLAHELTHVVQQNPGLQRKPRVQRKAESGVSATGGRKIQMDQWSFGPPGGKFFPGTKIHEDVLPMFAAENPDLFVEVSIPGANKEDVDTKKRGIADFYKAAPTGKGDDAGAVKGRSRKKAKAAAGRSRTIGIKLGDDGPAFLRPNSRLEGGGKGYQHGRHSAPRGGIHEPRVRGTDEAPTDIRLGDLKPGNSAESYLGLGQLTNYRDGIVNTASGIATWLREPANAGQSEGKTVWDPKPKNLGPTELKVPEKLDYFAPVGRTAGQGIHRFHLAVYKDLTMVEERSGLTGALFVYPHHVSGIWAYEWMPYEIPESTASGNVEKTLERLETEVINPVRETGTSMLPAVRRKARRQLRRHPKGKVRRKEFPYKQWKQDYGSWQKDTEASLATQDEKKHSNVASALMDADKRMGGKAKLPQKVRQNVKDRARVKHWLKFGGMYGWLRHTFNGIYVKIKELVTKIKNKVRRFARRVGGGFGSWTKAAIKAVFNIFKIVAKWTVTQVLDLLIGSLQRGITNLFNNILTKFTPEAVEEKLAHFEAKKKEFEDVVTDTVERIEKKLFGDKLDLIDALEKWEYIANIVGTIATLVEWGVRLLACAVPPAIGCLWNLVISALQWAFAKLMQTCWFTRKVYAPVMNAIDDVRNFPKVLAGEVVTAANKLLPMPDDMKLFEPITLEHTHLADEDCNDEGGGEPLTPEREAFLDLVEEIGPDKIKALLKFALKRGAGPWLLMTTERLAELKGTLEKVTVAQLEAAAENPDAEVPASLEEFAANAAKYSKKEKKLIRENELKKGEDKGDEAGKRDGGEGTGSGDGAGGSQYARPIEKQPSELDKTASFSTYFFAVTLLPEPLKPGVSYPNDMEIALLIRVIKGQLDGIAKVYPVRVKVKTVAADHVELVNLTTFHAFYLPDEWVQIRKDRVIWVPNDFLTNVDPKSIPVSK